LIRICRSHTVDDMPAKKPPPRHLLSVRSALVILIALLASACTVGLLHAARRPAPEVALGALGAFAAALELANQVIE